MDYRLDLRTLLLMLGQSTGSLDADLLHIQGIRGRARVQLQLENGHMHTCTITDASGTPKYTDSVALKLVQDLVLEWHYTEVDSTSLQIPQESSPQRQLVPVSSLPQMQLMPVSSIPVRTNIDIPHNFNSWPRLYRNVYSLVNGVASIDQIVGTIARGRDPRVVLDVLAQLQLAGLIVFKGSRADDRST
ncbi:MAG: hypothetical protein PVS3B1_13660 [Ktedonobacteraceae bacterium]